MALALGMRRRVQIMTWRDRQGYRRAICRRLQFNDQGPCVVQRFYESLIEIIQKSCGSLVRYQRHRRAELHAHHDERLSQLVMRSRNPDLRLITFRSVDGHNLFQLPAVLPITYITGFAPEIAPRQTPSQVGAIEKRKEENVCSAGRYSMTCVEP